jgi:hypothetical protein
MPDRVADVIKIDVQGFEMEVLRGAVRTIERCRPAVLCEVTPRALERAGSGVDALLEFFRSRSYRAELLPSGAGDVEPMSYRQLKNLFDRSGAEYRDVLFRPEPESDRPDQP